MMSAIIIIIIPSVHTYLIVERSANLPPCHNILLTPRLDGPAIVGSGFYLVISEIIEIDERIYDVYNDNPWPLSGNPGP
jgi:hypothetical protein